jgi:hypothetical protein
MKYAIKVHDGHYNSHESYIISSRNIYLHNQHSIHDSYPSFNNVITTTITINQLQYILIIQLHLYMILSNTVTYIKK